MVKLGFEPRQPGFGAQVFNQPLKEDSFSPVWHHKGNNTKKNLKRKKERKKEVHMVGRGGMSLTTAQ